MGPIKISSYLFTVIFLISFSQQVAFANSCSDQYRKTKKLYSNSVAVENLLEVYRNRGFNVQLKLSEHAQAKGGYQIEYSQIKTLLETVTKLEDQLKGHLHTPSKFDLELYDIYVSPDANFEMASTIRMGIQFGLEIKVDDPDYQGYKDGIPGYRKPMTQSRAILAHEYGHLVFHLNLLELKNPAASLTRDLEVTILEIKKLRAQYPQLEINTLAGTGINLDFDLALPKAQDSLLTPPVPDDIKARAQFLEQRLVEIRKSTDSKSRYYPVYSELFADVIAVIALKDPRAMGNAFYYQSGPEMGIYDAHSRNFDRKIKQLSKKDIATVHNRPNLVRNFIWENYLHRLINTPNAALFASRLLLAIDLELRSRIEAGTTDNDWTDLNEKLIERIKLVAKDL